MILFYTNSRGGLGTKPRPEKAVRGAAVLLSFITDVSKSGPSPLLRSILAVRKGMRR